MVCEVKSPSDRELRRPSFRASVDLSNDTARGSRRRLALAVFLLALAVRVVYVAQIRDNPFFESPVIDALTYHERAVALTQGVWHEQEVFWQPPLYPYFLGVLYSVFGPKIAVARSVQLLLGAAICALMALLARRLHGPLAGWTAGITLALCGTMIFFEGELLNPVLSIALNTGALLLLIPRAPDSARDGPFSAGNLSDFGRLPLGRWVGAGLLLGLSAICRPDILLFAGAWSRGRPCGRPCGPSARQGAPTGCGSWLSPPPYSYPSFR